MPPVNDHPCLILSVLIQPFFVFKHLPSEKIPKVVVENLINESGSFISVTRTTDEISVVGEWHDDLPAQYKGAATWKCIKIAGPMDFGLTGVISSLTAPLKEAKLSVFVVSTWNTDYVLVDGDKLSEVVKVLTADGWRFV